MSFSATRLTLYAILSSMETDLRKTITVNLDSGNVKGVIGEELWKKASDRWAKDQETKDNQASLEDLLFYIDLSGSSKLIGHC